MGFHLIDARFSLLSETVVLRDHSVFNERKTMKFYQILELLVRHKMIVLILALATAIVALGNSFVATLTAYSTGDFTLEGYWDVTSAVFAIAIALIEAMQGKADTDAEPPLIPRIRALFK